MEIRRVPREEMRANHAAAERALASVPVAAPPAANIDTLLDLGGTTYILFRGAPYGVPPVGWRLGLDLLALRQRAESAVVDGRLTPETTALYRATLQQITARLWRHIYPVARTRTGTAWRRFRQRWRLMRNPLRDASEQDVVILTDFCLRHRMRSSIGPAPVPPLPPSLITSTT